MANHSIETPNPLIYIEVYKFKIMIIIIIMFILNFKLKDELKSISDRTQLPYDTIKSFYSHFEVYIFLLFYNYCYNIGWCILYHRELKILIKFFLVFISG